MVATKGSVAMTTAASRPIPSPSSSKAHQALSTTKPVASRANSVSAAPVTTNTNEFEQAIVFIAAFARMIMSAPKIASVTESTTKSQLLIKKEQQLARQSSGTNDLSEEFSNLSTATDVYKSAHVRDLTLFHRSPIPVGVRSKKEWLIKNCGNVAWPSDTKFCYLRGDLSEGEPIDYPVGSVGVNHTAVVAVTVLPHREGRFTAYYRLKTGDKWFGVKYWVDVNATY